MAVWAGLMVPCTVIGILLAVPFLGPRRAFFTVGPWYARSVGWFCRVPITLHGWDQLPADIREGRQPVIFMSNHESQLDPPVLIGVLPLPAVYIAKKEVKYLPFVGWAAMVAGVIFIDRRDRERAIRSIHAAALEIRGGKNVVIFPEGTRSPTGRLLPFKKGGFALAQEAGVPIVPLATLGGFQVLPRGSALIRPGRYEVHVGAPVEASAYAERDALAEEVRRRIEVLISGAR
ncbi:1-acyl-sn-glycerol-3-phosphate acyltransferase [Geothrix rubra]|uniref:1-acyl-sn-glycerol-3-phosphate acyltransferase n=1 Tax=Geothrix rubra TaxID=2927977 RepID=A0ABQ5Q6Z8_9BACT|nr:lysophospholipid acyltransferase family protein [Geothrix rubra]GLH70448.1 1-acyl-sn-glycerol-3-phosphate acyltransferase [Geothrix rubra]